VTQRKAACPGHEQSARGDRQECSRATKGRTSNPMEHGPHRQSQRTPRGTRRMEPSGLPGCSPRGVRRRGLLSGPSGRAKSTARIQTGRQGRRKRQRGHHRAHQRHHSEPPAAPPPGPPAPPLRTTSGATSEATTCHHRAPATHRTGPIMAGQADPSRASGQQVRALPSPARAHAARERPGYPYM
jgi:hypothetical protein